jgi:alpha-tubulin suppressor-like RCC1 family protein
MRRLGCTPSWPSPPTHSAGRRRLAGRLAPAFAVLLVAALGCREDAESPTGPEATPLATTATAALAFYQVSAGWEHTCGVTTDNRGYCWGSNSQGDLGNGEPGLGASIPRPTPLAVAGGLQFRQISAGSFATCAVTTDFRAYCWGTNGRGELGDGTTTPRATPVPVTGGLRFRQVETNFQHTCGVTYPDNLAYCWGDNADGQLGDSTRINRLTPVAVARGLHFRQVSAGWYHTCGVTTDNRAFCWGLNRYGQIGDSSTAFRRLRPSRVARTRQFHQIDAGTYHTCAVTTDDQAFCWGNGTHGEIGNGKAYLSFWPRAVAGGHSITRVTAGGDHTCGETTGNRAYCWGANYNGALGDATTTQRLKPVAVVGDLAFSQVSAGSAFTCGKTPGAVAYCWGRGFLGQLGNGTTSSSSTPLAVAGAM